MNPHGQFRDADIAVVLAAIGIGYLLWELKLRPWLKRDKSADNLRCMELERARRKRAEREAL